MLLDENCAQPIASPRPSAGHDKKTFSFFTLTASHPRLTAIAIAASIATIATIVSSSYNASLGHTRYLAIPFFVGAISVLISNLFRVERWSVLKGVTNAFSSVFACGLFIFLTGINGLWTLLLSIPLVGTASGIGALLAVRLIEGFPKVRYQAIALIILTASICLFTGLESGRNRQPNLRHVVSTIEIDSTPAQVWKNSLEYPEIDSKPELLFSAGIAYPIRSAIEKPERGGARTTFFSTGAARQRISTYIENELLVFDILESPKPIIEVSPFTPSGDNHLENAMKARAGKIRLRPIESGKTELSYSLYNYQGLWPQNYWSAVSYYAVRRIEERIIRHIKKLSEKPVTAIAASTE